MRMSTSRRHLLRIGLAGLASAALPSGEAASQGTLTLADVNRMDLPTFVAAFGNVYDLSPWVATAAYAKRPFTTVTALHQALTDSFAHAPREQQQRFFRSLDDIGDGVTKAEAVTAAARSGQTTSGINALSVADHTRLLALNTAYRRKFDMPFVICVRRNTVDTIFTQYERRLGENPSSELATAIQEQFYISRLRVAEQVKGEGMPKVYGDLTAHVLNAMVGKPASGVTVELFEVNGTASHKLSQAVTNADGRADVMSGQPLQIGRYELRFAVGDYFRKNGATAGDKPFLDVVPMRMFIGKPEESYHVPLICTPYSYTVHG